MAKGRTFKNKVICHTNDFKDKINENIKKWIESNGGKFSRELTPEVTHLIASKKAWKKYYPIVKQARRMRTVRIVKLDWLEMSLTTPPYKALPEDQWSYEQQKLKFVKRSKKKPQVSAGESEKAAKKIIIPRDKRIEATGIEFDKVCREFEEDLAATGFHPYSDRTGFVYIIALLRHDILKNRFEKYRLKVGDSLPTTLRALPFLPEASAEQVIYRFQKPYPFSSAQVLPYDLSKELKHNSRIHLAKPWAQCIQLYESDNIPHTYACYAQYTRPAVQKQVQILAPPGSTWPFAWNMFEKFFARKTGVNWDQRIGVGVEIDLDGFTKDEDGSSDTDTEREPRVRNRNVQFQYLAPRPGEPDGIRGKLQDRDFKLEDRQSIIDSIALTQDLESGMVLDEKTNDDERQAIHPGDVAHRSGDIDADADDEMTEHDDAEHVDLP